MRVGEGSGPPRIGLAREAEAPRAAPLSPSARVPLPAAAPGTTAVDRARVASAGRWPAPLASFVEAHAFGPRIDAVRAGRAGVAPGERAEVRAQLATLDLGGLSRLRAALVLEPPHPALAAMRGHPAVAGRPSVEGVLALLSGEVPGIAAARVASPRAVTALESASPSSSVVSTGARVRVRRSSGAIEDGWTVRSRTPDGDVVVARPEAGAFKKVSAGRLLADNPELLRPGTPVQVRRSSGALEVGWQIVGAVAGERVRVVGPGGAAKDLALDALLGANPALLGGGAPPSIAERLFAPGREVSVVRSSGAVEAGWRIALFDRGASEVVVASGPAVKRVAAAELLRGNPALVPPGTQVAQRGAHGLAEDGWTVLGPDGPGLALVGPGGERHQVSVDALLAENPGLLAGGPATAVSGGVPRIGPPAAAAQSEAFRTGHRLAVGAAALDGHVDGGRGMSVDADGRVLASREVITLDRARDPALRAQLAFARSLRDLPPATRARALAEHVDNLFTPPDRDPLRADAALVARFTGKEVLLGEIPGLVGGGTCRHRSLMFKVLADEAGLAVSLQRGNASFAGASGAHAWNELELEGRRLVVDVMNPTRVNGRIEFPSTSDAAVRAAYRDVAGRPLYEGGGG